MSRPLVIRLVAVALLAGLLAFLALRTSPYLQYIPGMPRWIGVWADSHGIARNVVAFGLLALVVLLLLGHHLPQVLGLAAFGIGLEVSQLWIRGRVFDWRDILASLAGIALAWPIAWLLRRRMSRTPC